MPSYPKRLIEVDLPIARISAHARREKSIRHGHISTLHIWWARRPLAACRAVICAALWPDPTDENCPQAFRDAATRLINEFARKADGDLKLLATSSEESKRRWATLVKNPVDSDSSASLAILRSALLDFIADFANWDNSTVTAYLVTSRALTQAAHEALGGEPGTRPLVVDPFAGGGSIPLEALRVGADAFASDLNPVPVLLNKVVLEYIPKYGQRLADEVRKWGEEILQKAEQELQKFYPADPDGATPVAYIWARTVKCEGPGCGVEVPLIRSLWVARKPKRSVAFKLVVGQGKIEVQLDHFATSATVKSGTTARGSVTCPACGFTTPPPRVKEQLRQRRGGVVDSRLLAVVTSQGDSEGVSYRLPTDADLSVVRAVAARLTAVNMARSGELSAVPNEPYPGASASGALSSSVLYGAQTWGDIFSPRQALTLVTFSQLVARIPSMAKGNGDLGVATATCLAFCVSKLADYLSSLCVWRTARSCAAHTFGRQALPMAWDYGEMNPFAGSAGDWGEAVRYMCMFIAENSEGMPSIGSATRANATKLPLPDDSAQAVFTDPPYYDAIAYGDLSDFFYVWLRRCIGEYHGSLFADQLVDKREEIVQLSKRYPGAYAHKTKDYFEAQMTLALRQSRVLLAPSGIGVVVFAHKSTAGWEAMLQSLIAAGWIVTGSWPIDTERGGRLNSNDAASLASSVHIVCRPRENPDGAVRTDEIGDWRDVLQDLPKRIHEWMPRLADEGVVGADAIFACLGPALEVFSRYSRVEKASGEIATLREYLEHVWAAVSTEALSMIFRDADAAGLEPDARITAMWLWTLGGGKSATNGNGPHPNLLPKGEGTTSDTLPEGEGTEEDEAGDEEEAGGAKAKGVGYILEFDAARKIAQGLGIHLEKSESIVAVKGETARLLPVAERTQYLFGKDAVAGTTRTGKSKKKAKQKTLFDELDDAEAAEAGWTELKGPPPGATVLDRLHQAMILFAAGRGELMKRFLLDDGVGTDSRFWKLAQSLSALYPPGTDEKRWVDGVLARKKGLGL